MANKSGKKQYNILYVMLCFAIIILLCGIARADVNYSIWPEAISYGNGGEEISVPINVSNIGGLESWDILIKYNPDVLEFLNIDILDTLSAQYYQVVPGPEYDPELGGVRVAGMLYFDANSISPPPEEGTGGVLFKANFQITDQTPATTNISIDVLTEGPPDQLLTTGSGVLYAETGFHYEVALGRDFIRATEGKYVWVPIVINSSEDLTYWNIVVNYDSTYLDYIDYMLTDLLEAGYDLPDGAVVVNESTPGTIEAGGMTLVDQEGGAGALLKLKFKAKNKIGNSEISLSFPPGTDNQLGSVTEDSGIVQVQKYVPPSPVMPLFLHSLPTFMPTGWTFLQTLPSITPISMYYPNISLYDIFYYRLYGIFDTQLYGRLSPRPYNVYYGRWF